MSVPFGVDLGNDNTVVACARNRGIDIIVNEVSNRLTPSLVGFGQKNRFIGESAKTQQTSNIKNTVDNLKRILGLRHADPDFATEEKFFSAKLKEGEFGEVAAEVRFQNESKTFSLTQLTAMYINKIKDIAAKETKGTIQDICLSVPVWYTERQRRAAWDACKVAGLNPVRIVNEVTAAAVGYGVFKQNDLPEDEPRIVAFVDVGHSSYQVLIAAVKKGELKVLGLAYDKHFGGRDFDRAIADHFAEQFKAKYKIDVRENPKAYYRVLAALEKVKKVLLANSQAPINIESVMNDVDVLLLLTREELEEFVQPLLERIHVPIEVALRDAKLEVGQIDLIEIIGGCTRVPSVKSRLSEIFGKPLSTTLNQDEAIARGNAFICAMHLPTLRVRPFKFEDFNPYSVAYHWDQQAEAESLMEVFPRGGVFPSTKIITLARTGDFEVSAQYAKMEEVHKGTDALIARWSVLGVTLPEGAESVEAKLKLRNDPSGFYTIELAHTVEEKTVKELVEKEEEDAEPEYREVKKVVKREDLKVVISLAALPKATRQAYFEQENAMVVADKLVFDTEDRKNALEEYIYELRGKLEEQYAPFASDDEKARLTEKLAAAEEWLYDDGYDSTKAKYIAKYEDLAAIGNLIKGRYLAKEEEKRQAVRQKQEAAQMAAMAEKMAAANKGKPEASDASDAKEEPKEAEEMDVD